MKWRGKAAVLEADIMRLMMSPRFIEYKYFWDDTYTCIVVNLKITDLFLPHTGKFFYPVIYKAYNVSHNFHSFHWAVKIDSALNHEDFACSTEEILQ